MVVAYLSEVVMPPDIILRHEGFASEIAGVAVKVLQPQRLAQNKVATAATGAEYIVVLLYWSKNRRIA